MTNSVWRRIIGLSNLIKLQKLSNNDLEVIGMKMENIYFTTYVVQQYIVYGDGEDLWGKRAEEKGRVPPPTPIKTLNAHKI